MTVWSSPELYVAAAAVVGGTGLAFFLTAPGRMKNRRDKGATAPLTTTPFSVAPVKVPPPDAVERYRLPGAKVMSDPTPTPSSPVAAEHVVTRFSDLAGVDEAMTEVRE